MNDLHAPRSRQPAINLPAVVTGLIVLLGVIHLYRSSWLTPAEDEVVLFDYAMVPARWSMAYLSGGIEAVVQAIRAAGGINMQAQLAWAQMLYQEGGNPWTALTYAFLHDSWMHFGFNAIWLAVFGAPLARRWGSFWFILFSILTALTGALMHFATQPYSIIPTIGASGVVSGMFGAAAWYVFDRNPRIGVSADSALKPRLRLVDIARNKTALAFIVFWFIGNYLFALMPGSFAGENVEVAWQAHIGGFLGGFLAFPLIDDFRRKAENP